LKYLVEVILLSAGLFAGLWQARAAERTERYALFLSQAPVTAHYSGQALQAAAARGYRENLVTQQAALRRELAARSVRVTGAAQVVLNAVFVEAAPSRVAELAAIPGVRGVARLHRFHENLNKAVLLMDVPAAWSTLGGTGHAGAGIKIAIIDSGIDQNHPAFQDSALSLPPGYTCGSGDQPGEQPQDCSFTNNKVIIARSYVEELASGSLTGGYSQSRPDDLTPRDHSGHGTALAMIAAGETVTGPLATITGIAPKAWLGNYKVFGSPGVNDFTGGDVLISAIEDALTDGMDVAVLALGSPALTGPLDTGAACGNAAGVPCDPEAQAVENAVQAGMLIVVSAGNDQQTGAYAYTPTLSTVESPGTAPSAITVGASTNSHVFVNEVRVPGSGVPSNIQTIPAVYGSGPLEPSPLTAPLVDVATLDSTGFACSALPSGSLNGRIGLVVRNTSCSDATAVMNAENAGAAGVIIVQNNGSEDVSLPPDDPYAGIPAVLIGASEGNALKVYLSSHAGLQVTLDASTITPVDVTSQDAVPPNELTFFSSVGPSITYLVKPELVGVGQDVYMATQTFDSNSFMWDPSGFTAQSGTSFPAPMVAGAVALVKQQHPDFTPAQLKSAVIGTATQDVQEQDSLATGTADTLAVGNGKLDVGLAVLAQVTTDPATISFGALGQTATLPVAQQLRVHYAGSSPATLTLTLTGQGRLPSLSQSTLSFTPGQSDQAVTLTLSGTLPAPGIYEGALMIQGAGPAIRVPYLYLVGNGIPDNIVPLAGGTFEGPAGQLVPGGLALRVIDRYGVAVPNVAVQFAASSGGGSIQTSDSQTDSNGVAVADAVMGPQAGDQEFVAFIGTGGNQLSIPFIGTAEAVPTIFAGGAVNAASYRATPGVVPGSYIALFGNALGSTTAGAIALPLPPGISDYYSGIGTSVSFEVPSSTPSNPPSISLPGSMLYVSPGQVNVQVPWELAGQTSVQIRVNVGSATGAVYTAPIAAVNPGTYMMPDRTAIAVNSNLNLITTSSRAVPGQIIHVYANGLGPVSPTPPDGQAVPLTPLTTTAQPVTATIAGIPATVQFSGLTPFYPSVGDVQITVPSNAPAGLQLLVLTINGVSSPPVNLWVQ
jgi:minor extracellular serine protease Vpr